MIFCQDLKGIFWLLAWVIGMRINLHIWVDDGSSWVQFNVATLNDQVRTVDDDISHRLCRGHASARLDGFPYVGAVVANCLVLDVLIPVGRTHAQRESR